jgi:hypothetical protein
MASRAWPRHIMVTPTMSVNGARDRAFNGRSRRENSWNEKHSLLQGAGMEISVHVDAAECPFYGIYFAVLIAIELLEVIVGEIK